VAGIQGAAGHGGFFFETGGAAGRAGNPGTVGDAMRGKAAGFVTS